MNSLNIEKKINLFNEDNIYFFTDPKWIRWISNFELSFGYLLIYKKKIHILTDKRYLSRLKKSLEKFDYFLVEEVNIDYIAELINKSKVIMLDESEPYVTIEKIKKIVKGGENKEINVTNNSNLRRVKMDYEVKNIKRAISISKKAFEETIEFINNSVKKITEKDIQNFLIFSIRNNGADKESFNPIIASGKNSANPHYTPSNKKYIKNNEIITIDFGAKFNGYCSDITRVIKVKNGNFDNAKNDEEISFINNIYKILIKVKNDAIKQIEVGKYWKEIDEFIRLELSKYNLEKYFIHSTGHGVGLEIHESPSISKFSNEKIISGEIVTIEPGVYIKGKFGLRVEDDILVSDKENIILTKSIKYTKSLTE